MTSSAQPEIGQESAPRLPAPRRPSSPGLFGSGLDASALGTLLALSVALFLFWGGPLWRAPAGASHIVRISVSYLVAVPSIVAALLVARRWSWVHFFSSLGLLWSVKLLVTASAYAWIVQDAASRYQPAPAHEAARAAASSPRYHAAASSPSLPDLSGTVIEHGVPVAGAVVVVEQPPPGLPLAAPRTVTVTISGTRHRAPTVLAFTSDQLVIENRDAALHTVRFTRDGRPLWNVPVPAGVGPRAVTMPAAGLYQLSCESHAEERATLLVVDHPYAAQADGAGRFLLRGMAPGDHPLLVLRHGRPPLRRILHVAPRPGEVLIEIAPDITDTKGAP